MREAKRQKRQRLRFPIDVTRGSRKLDGKKTRKKGRWTKENYEIVTKLDKFGKEERLEGEEGQGKGTGARHNTQSTGGTKRSAHFAQDGKQICV
jgi:hypothetical protein